MGTSLHRSGRGFVRNIFLEIRGVTEDEALRKALRHLKKHTRRLKRGYWVSPGILLPLRRPRQKSVKASRMLRVKHFYAGKRILDVKDPRECFVKGYGPRALKRLADL